MFFICNNLFRVAMNVIFPLFGLLEFRWLSKNLRMFVIVSTTVSHTGSVGSVTPPKYFSSLSISSCQCYCISCCRPRIAQSPPSRLRRDGETSAETMHTLFSPTAPFLDLVRLWRNLCASGVTCAPLA
jgi:hypothetical protein